MMTEIVINCCYGGFGLSQDALDLYNKYSGKSIDSLYYEFTRTDPILVRVVEELGDKANGSCSRLIVYELEPGTKYRIEDYDGYESIETEDDIDWSIA